MVEENKMLTGVLKNYQYNGSFVVETENDIFGISLQSEINPLFTPTGIKVRGFINKYNLFQITEKVN